MSKLFLESLDDILPAQKSGISRLSEDDISVSIHPRNKLRGVLESCYKNRLILGKRPKWRDYVDLYFLLKNKYISLGELIELSKKKFASDFSERLFLEQLVYWNDIGNYVVEFVGKEIPPSEIKLFFEDEVKRMKENLF